jgi:hypothetical protein
MSTSHVVKGDWSTYVTTFPASSKKYREQNDAIDTLFREHVAEINGMTNHPKRDRVYTLAWAMGHSSGYHEVADYFSDFSEVLFYDEQTS